MSEIIRATDISVQDADTMILHPTDVKIGHGLTMIVGPSGSGKSTLANTLFGLIRPSSGSVDHLDGNGETVYQNAPESSKSLLSRVAGGLLLETRQERRNAEYRSRNLGYIAQLPYIHPRLRAHDYVGLVHQARGNLLDGEYVNGLYKQLDISGHVSKPAAKLSGGELQRFSIAFAFAHEPRLVVADEPTSALDTENKERAMNLFRGIVDEGTTSILMVSHDPEAIRYADTVIRMQDGKICEIARQV